MRLFRLWSPVILWMAVIVSLSSFPGAMIPRITIPHADKAVHLAEYYILSLLLLKAFAGTFPLLGTLKEALICVIIASLFAVFDELHQAGIAGRTAHIADLAADMIGIDLGIIITLYRRHRRGNDTTVSRDPL